jgi:hypothetical protein
VVSRDIQLEANSQHCVYSALYRHQVFLSCISLNTPIPWSRVLLEKLTVSQQIPSLLWNLKVHYRIHKSPPLFSVLSQWIQSTPFHRSFTIHSQISFNITSFGAHPASCRMGTGGSFPGVKRPRREADHSPPSSAEVKNGVRKGLLSLHNRVQTGSGAHSASCLMGTGG